MKIIKRLFRKGIWGYHVINNVVWHLYFVVVAVGLFIIGYGLVMDDGQSAAGIGVPVLVLGMLLTIAYSLLLYSHAQRLDLSKQLIANQSLIREGGSIRYKGAELSSDTPVTTHLIAVSFVIYTARFPLWYMVPGRNLISIRILASLLTLFLGWWFIPWGPVYTIQALVTDLRGGMSETVDEIIWKLTDETGSFWA